MASAKRPVGRPRESLRLAVRVPLDEAEMVQLLAERDGVTVSDVLRRYVREGLRRDEDAEARTRLTAHDRITVDPEQMGGSPCVRHLRISVVTVWRLVRAGLSLDEIREDYPDLDEEDVTQAVDYVRTSLVVSRLTREASCDELAELRRKAAALDALPAIPVKGCAGCRFYSRAYGSPNICTATPGEPVILPDGPAPQRAPARCPLRESPRLVRLTDDS